MADETSGVQRSISKIKQWIGWSWTYLWGFWFLLVIFLLYVLRTPLRLKENLNLGKLLIFTWLSRKIDQKISQFFLKKANFPANTGKWVISVIINQVLFVCSHLSPLLDFLVNFIRKTNRKWQTGWPCVVSCFYRLPFIVCVWLFLLNTTYINPLNLRWAYNCVHFEVSFIVSLDYKCVNFIFKVEWPFDLLAVIHEVLRQH